MNCNIIDLRKVAGDLGIRVNSDEYDQAYSRCEFCGSKIYQEDELCSCGAHVIWKHSVVWSKNYGSPEVAMRKYSYITPTSVTGKELCDAVGVNGFRTIHDDDDWAAAERKFGQSDMRSIIRYVKNSNSCSMSHALAIARKKEREAPRKVKEVQEAEHPLW
jgi:hypothetical protein